MIRALYRSIKVPTAAVPYDTITLKLFYQAAPTGSAAERNTGVIPADTRHAPLPVVILMSGVNVGMECYQWLAERLAQTGLAVVTYNWVAEDLPGYVSLTPGVNLAAFRPDTYGSQPTSTALAPILAELAVLNETSGHPCAGLLDLAHVIVGGHSAGGTIALQNGHPDWFPQVSAVFSYGAHTMASTMLGYPPETILPLPPTCPCLIIGGTQDGVIAASSGRYASEAGSATAAVERTFHEAVQGGRGDCYLALLEGANHFAMAHPHDETLGRAFLEHAPTQPPDQLRDLLAELIVQFIHAHGRRSATPMSPLQHPLITQFHAK